MSPSTPADHFERLYAEKGDPWDLATSEYEVQKYAATIAALGGRRFTNAIEIGCSIGTLTARLAPLCDALLGVDYVEAPLNEARQRCAALPQVRFRRMSIPDEWPEGAFDLMMVSEVLYFMSADDHAALARRCDQAATTSATILMVNWLGPNDGVMPGEVAARTFMEALGEGWVWENAATNTQYRIDLGRRR